MQIIDIHIRLLGHHGERLLQLCRAWSLDTLEEPPIRVVDAGQKTPTPMSDFNDRECQLSVIANNFGDQCHKINRSQQPFQALRRVLGTLTEYGLGFKWSTQHHRLM